jgi:hypothetical protein
MQQRCFKSENYKSNHMKQSTKERKNKKEVKILAAVSEIVSTKF